MALVQAVECSNNPTQSMLLALDRRDDLLMFVARLMRILDGPTTFCPIFRRFPWLYVISRAEKEPWYNIK
jgi:hypothetical protein